MYKIKIRNKLSSFFIFILIFMIVFAGYFYNNFTISASDKIEEPKTDNLINPNKGDKDSKDVSVHKNNDFYTKEFLDQYFGTNDMELVLELPEGGFLGGDPNAIWQVTDEKGKLTSFTIASNPKSETVAEAKLRLLNKPIKYEE